MATRHSYLYHTKKTHQIGDVREERIIIIIIIMHIYIGVLLNKVKQASCKPTTKLQRKQVKTDKNAKTSKNPKAVKVT